VTIKARCINYNCIFIVQATVTTIVNYNFNTFIVQAARFTFECFFIHVLSSNKKKEEETLRNRERKGETEERERERRERERVFDVSRHRFHQNKGSFCNPAKRE